MILKYIFLEMNLFREKESANIKMSQCNAMLVDNYEQLCD